MKHKEIGYKDIKKGYELSKDKYTAIDKKEIDDIKIKTSKTIDIKEFIEAKDLDPVLIEKSYFIAPEMRRGVVDKTYVLFAAILNDTNKVAIGKVVLKDKHVIALRAYQKGIILHVLHFLDEVRPTDEIAEITQVQKMKIDNKAAFLSTEHFDLSKYSDSYSKELKRLIEAKSKRKTYTKSVEVEKEAPKDLVAALKASLQKSKKSKL